MVECLCEKFQTAHTDMDHNSFLSLDFLHLEGPLDTTVESDVSRNGFCLFMIS